jgi:hypothetical protein
MIFVFAALSFACGVLAWRGMPRERARDERGRFVADDPATPFVNEAWRRKD